MNPQEYILSKLNSLNEIQVVEPKPETKQELVEVVLKHLLSKKFRKFSIPEKNLEIIKKAVEKNILNNEPIKISFPFGEYKLWRLDESPECDWAELLSLIYFANWLKPVCAIYKPGVEFTFWSDQVVISKMNNISEDDLSVYDASFKKLLIFIESYVPTNLVFSLFQERSRYKGVGEFEKELAIEVEKLRQVRLLDPKSLSEAAIRSIEMNVKLLPGQAEDLEWREKIDLLHNAYYNLQDKNTHVRQPYSQENITAFTIFFEPNVIPVGSAKTSIVRFWVGVGLLQKRKDSYIENIFSITQLEKGKFEWANVKIDGLEGKNFNRIRIAG